MCPYFAWGHSGILKKRNISNVFHKLVGENYKQSTPYKVYPEIQSRTLISLKRGVDTLLHGLCLNVAYTASFLHPIRRADSPECESGYPAEDVNPCFIERSWFDKPRMDPNLRLLVHENRLFATRKSIGTLVNSCTTKESAAYIAWFYFGNWLSGQLMPAVFLLGTKGTLLTFTLQM